MMRNNKYIKPSKQQVEINNSISILMVTIPSSGLGEDGGQIQSLNASPIFNNNPLKVAPSESSTPFGSSRPDYQ